MHLMNYEVQYALYPMPRIPRLMICCEEPIKTSVAWGSKPHDCLLGESNHKYVTDTL